MGAKYQMKHKAEKHKLLKISFLQGDPSSRSMALFLYRVFDEAGWDVQINARTDIAYVTGLCIFQDSIENSYEGVQELRTFARENNIPVVFEEQPGTSPFGSFEIWIGKGPEKPMQP